MDSGNAARARTQAHQRLQGRLQAGRRRGKRQTRLRLTGLDTQPLLHRSNRACEPLAALRQVLVDISSARGVAVRCGDAPARV